MFRPNTPNPLIFAAISVVLSLMIGAPALNLVGRSLWSIASQVTEEANAHQSRD